MRPDPLPATGAPRTWVATPRQAGAVAGLMIEFRDWLGRDRPADERFHAGAERLLADPATEFLLGAPGGGASPAAVCQLRFRFAIWEDAPDCRLEDLYVRGPARRSGLGAALVEHACERARARGCRRIELDANEANPPALALYERLGFSSFSDPPGGRNLLMRRPL